MACLAICCLPLQEHLGSGFFTDYERTKYLADQIAVRAAREEGLDVVTVYPGVIYGPGRVSTANLLVKMVRHWSANGVPVATLSAPYCSVFLARASACTYYVRVYAVYMPVRMA